jgi:hypothetical protein
MSTKKNKKEKDIIFPVIQECIQYLEGTFWETFFDDLSRGKKTKNIIINNKCISTTTKRGGFIYNYSDKDAKTIAIELKNILLSIGIYSDEDIKSNDNIKNASNEYLKMTEENEWKKIKNKKMKEQLITDFVISQRNKYKTSWNIAKDLYSLLIDSFFLLKTHKPNDVIMNGGKIENIIDIEWNNEIKLFINSRINYDENENKNKKDSNTLLNKYTKYITSLTKLIKHSK